MFCSIIFLYQIFHLKLVISYACTQQNTHENTRRHSFKYSFNFDLHDLKKVCLTLIIWKDCACNFCWCSLYFRNLNLIHDWIWQALENSKFALLYDIKYLHFSATLFCLWIKSKWDKRKVMKFGIFTIIYFSKWYIYVTWSRGMSRMSLILILFWVI